MSLVLWHSLYPRVCFLLAMHFALRYHGLSGCILDMFATPRRGLHCLGCGRCWVHGFGVVVGCCHSRRSSSQSINGSGSSSSSGSSQVQSTRAIEATPANTTIHHRVDDATGETQATPTTQQYESMACHTANTPPISKRSKNNGADHSNEHQ